MLKHYGLISTRLAIITGMILLLPAARLLGAKDFTFETAQAAAAKGDPQAQFYLSRLYAHGQGVPQDYGRAVAYLRLSADQGYVRAENNLGAYYASGLGVPQSYSESAAWFRKAAEQGDPLAEFSLGQAYEFGQGLPTNQLEAVKWYQKAAEQNQTNAISALADLYLGGRGVPADYEKARQWFEKAAAAGSIEALNSLGFIYELGGAGVTQNRPLACTYYRRAAVKGLPKGQLNLGRAYLFGIGVPADFVEAGKWFYLASRNGEGIARHYLEELEGKVKFGDLPGKPLTSEQINEAVRRASEFENGRAQHT